MAESLNALLRKAFYHCWRWLDRWASIVAVCLACLTLLLIGFGIGLSGDVEFDLAGCSDILYESAQVLSLNKDPHYDAASSDQADTVIRPWISSLLLSLGRLSAVLFVVFVSIQVLEYFLGNSWKHFWLSQKRKHHIVCGLGDIGWEVAQLLHRRGDRVVVIENEADHPRLHALRELGGAMLLQGNATERVRLLEARAQHAEAIYAVTDNDAANLEIGSEFDSIRNELLKNNVALPIQHVFLNISDHSLNQSLVAALHEDGDKRLHPPIFLMQ